MFIMGRTSLDRFRPLEDPDAPATRAWIEAENRETFAFLESIPQRDAIKRRLTELGISRSMRRQTGRGAVFLHLQQGPPEPERALHERIA